MNLTEARRQALQAQLKAAIDDANKQAGVALAQAALAEGITPVVLFQDVIQPVLQEIGGRITAPRCLLARTDAAPGWSSRPCSKRCSNQPFGRAEAKAGRRAPW